MPEYSIEIDCPPGNPRPGDLLPGVIEGTGLKLDPEKTAVRLFGHWMWTIPDDQIETFIKARPIVKERLTKLYERGLVRYASW